MQLGSPWVPGEDKLPPAQIRKRAHLHNYINDITQSSRRRESLTRVQNDNCSPPPPTLLQQQPANLFRVHAQQTRAGHTLDEHVELRINQTLFIKFSLSVCGAPALRKHTQNHIYSSSGLLRPLGQRGLHHHQPAKSTAPQPLTLAMRAPTLFRVELPMRRERSASLRVPLLRFCGFCLLFAAWVLISVWLRGGTSRETVCLLFADICIRTLDF